MFYEHLGPVPVRTFKVKLCIPGMELLYEVQAFDFIGAIAEAQQQYSARYDDDRALQQARWYVSIDE